MIRRQFLRAIAVTSALVALPADDMPPSPTEPGVGRPRTSCA
ncbi:hypothetical protein [Streptomyces sp. NBC_00582]|nr:hypothetical protein [Streptomyces sp. NBC_00582]WUB67466.1 hypothetical protein OG852_47295 [Streptomyces sp. NBC_00582]